MDMNAKKLIYYLDSYLRKYNGSGDHAKEQN